MNWVSDIESGIDWGIRLGDKTSATFVFSPAIGVEVGEHRTGRHREWCEREEDTHSTKAFPFWREDKLEIVFIGLPIEAL